MANVPVTPTNPLLHPNHPAETHPSTHKAGKADNVVLQELASAASESLKGFQDRHNFEFTTIRAYITELERRLTVYDPVWRDRPKNP